jgi:hypothetical protein
MSDEQKNIVNAPSEDLEAHLESVLRRYATNTVSVINLLEQGQHVAAWKKVQGIRDGLAYYVNALEQRRNGTDNADTSE